MLPCGASGPVVGPVGKKIGMASGLVLPVVCLKEAWMLVLSIRCSCDGLLLKGLCKPVPRLQHCTFKLVCISSCQSTVLH